MSLKLSIEIGRKGLFILIMFSTTLVCFPQHKLKPNKYYHTTKETQTLDSIFPVDEIESITVRNYNGTHKLTQKELAVLKQQLKKAKFAGGLLVKPGHITLNIKLKGKSAARTGFVYAYKGSVNFDEGINRLGQSFSGTYELPLLINFDNFK